MKARGIMQADVVTVTPEMSIAQGQRLMHDAGIRHLPVVSKDQLVGMVTDRDIRDAAPSPATTLSKGEINYQMDQTSIRTCMTPYVITASPDDDDVKMARALLNHRVGSVPVVENKHLVGMITEIDCLQVFVTSPGPEGQLAAAVEDYMQTDVITAAPETLVSTVLQQMRGHRIRHIPVVTESKQLVGLVTDRDIRQAGASDEPHLAQYDLNHLLQKMTVDTMMTTQLHTVRKQATVTEAGRLLLDHKIGCLPVVRDDDILDGIITVTDLLRAYVTQQETAGQVS